MKNLTIIIIVAVIIIVYDNKKLSWNRKFYLIIFRIAIINLIKSNDRSFMRALVQFVRGKRTAKRIRRCFLSPLPRPQPLPNTNKDRESRFLRNSRSGFRAFAPILLLRHIKEGGKFAWVAYAREITAVYDKKIDKDTSKQTTFLEE